MRFALCARCFGLRMLRFRMCTLCFTPRLRSSESQPLHPAKGTDKSVCAIWTAPSSLNAVTGTAGVAQTLLSVLVKLGTPAKIHAVAQLSKIET
jgi:hypothetical protein